MKVTKTTVGSVTRRPKYRFIKPEIALLPFAFLVLSCSVNGQATRALSGPSDDATSAIEEMRARWDIKFAEKERHENLDRAREAAQLGSEIQITYTRNNSFSPTEKKKLDRLEKVTRKIRSRAGGSDGDVTLKDMSNQMATLLKRLSETAEELKTAVEKTPRQIVSATVIERSNELLEIIRYVRSFMR